MALLFLDSFDHYATADITEKWTSTSVAGTGSVAAVTSAIGRRSSQGWRWSTGTPSASTAGWIQRNLTATDATVLLGFAFRTSGVPGSVGMQIAFVRDAVPTTLLTLRLNQNMTLSVINGNSAGTVLGTSPVGLALTADLFAYIEWKTLIANSGGTTEVRVNGAPVLALTGLDTQTNLAAWTGAGLGQISFLSNSVGSNRTVDYDDFYVCDGTGAAPWNSFLGDCRVDALYPTAEGASSAWTPSTGTDNALVVDDTPPNDDTDYTSTATLGAIDTFVLPDAPAPGQLLYGVQHCLSMKKGDVGSCTVAPVIRHGSTDYPASALTVGESYAYGLQIAATNPGTSAAWTEADFNAAEFGYQRIG